METATEPWEKYKAHGDCNRTMREPNPLETATEPWENTTLMDATELRENQTL